MEHGEHTPEISFRARFGLWMAAWGLAAIATVGTAPGILFWAWLFPVGLLGLFVPPDSDSHITPLYVSLSFYGLAQGKRSRYFLVYGILIVFLLVNVAGCHAQVRQLKINC
jgi:hypothetical protein